ncbi:unnamed protein product [Ixodes persulcatus]
MGVQHVRKWCREFKDERTDVHGNSVLDGYRFRTKRLRKWKKMLKGRATAWELCEMIPDVSKTWIDNILMTDHLGYAKVCARWVPRMLTKDHKRQRVEAAPEFLQAYETEGEEFLDTIVTGDETWVRYTTPEMKPYRQWKHPESLKPRKFKRTLSAGKVMAGVF